MIATVVSRTVSAIHIENLSIRFLMHTKMQCSNVNPYALGSYKCATGVAINTLQDLN